MTTDETPTEADRLIDLMEEIPSAAEIVEDLECAESVETIADFVANLREAAKKARELAAECERVAKMATR